MSFQLEKRALRILVMGAACLGGGLGCGEEGDGAPSAVAAGLDDVTGVTWLAVPEGTFASSMDGAPASVAGFEVAKTEVTVAQFEKCLAAGACAAETYWAYDASTVKQSFCNWGSPAKEDHPMNCVNWHGAEAFCQWAGGRLPTELEWEYAATHDGQLARKTRYPWGEDAPEHCQHANYNGSGTTPDIACDGPIEAREAQGTAAVGSYAAGESPLGLQDLAGNVMEWTATLNEASQHITKGGSWRDDTAFLEISARQAVLPSLWSETYGFRCLR